MTRGEFSDGGLTTKRVVGISKRVTGHAAVGD